jgi:hypothetical protein
MIKLVCTGAPGERQTLLKQYAQEMNLSDRIVFSDYLSDFDLSVLMSNAAGVIFPSLYEGFGLPVIEAMAAGIPVACSNVTSLPEVANHAAIFFNPRIPTEIADAIISLITNRAQQETLISAGKVRAIEFTDTSRMAQEYLTLFHQALNEKKRSYEIDGIYHDGWASYSVAIQIPPERREKNIEIEFIAPDWLPHRKISVKTTYGRKKQHHSVHKIRRGESACIVLPIPSDGRGYHIHISPAFTGAQIEGAEGDQRRLSLMVKTCRAVSASGEYIELFPQEKLA